MRRSRLIEGQIPLRLFKTSSRPVYGPQALDIVNAVLIGAEPDYFAYVELEMGSVLKHSRSYE